MQGCWCHTLLCVGLHRVGPLSHPGVDLKGWAHRKQCVFRGVRACQVAAARDLVMTLW